MKRIIPLLALLIALVSPALAGRLDPRTATFPAPAFVPPQPVEKTLPGGAKLFLGEDRDVGLVRVYIHFAGGSLYDPEGLEGLADVTGDLWRSGGTAMMSPEAFDEALEARGIELSLGLGRDTGSATLSLLPRDLETGLDLLAGLILTPAFDPDRFAWAVAQKKDSVRRERDDPDALAFRAMRKTLYEGHPRARQATVKSVEAIRREDALALHRELLSSSAWVLGAVGDFDPDALARALEKRFASLPGKRGPRFAPPPPPKPIEPKIVFVPKKLNQTTVLWASLAPGLLSADRAPLDVADFILGGSGFQSRLMRKIRIEKGLAYSVSSFYSPMEEFGVVGATGATASAKAGEMLRLMAEEIERGATEGFTGREVEEAKTTEQNRFIFRYDDPADLVAERMTLELKGLPRDLVESHFRALTAASPEEARRAAASYFRPREGVWVVVGEADQADPAFDFGLRKNVAGDE